MTMSRRTPPDADQARPVPARIYAYLLTGADSFQVERDAAERIMAVVPELREGVWAHLGFHQRAAKWIAEQGVRQFIDIGSVPAVRNTHKVVQRVDPACRVVYVDNDPMLAARPEDLQADPARVRVIQGGLRDPEGILVHPDVHTLLDLDQPTGLLMMRVAHFVPDESDPWGRVSHLAAALRPGSYVALSHLTSDHLPPRLVDVVCHVYEQATEQVHFRSKADIERFFSGMELVPPTEGEPVGRLCHTGEWGAEDPVVADSDGSRWLYCGVARRP
ncbi:MAG TPA: SAM-dependent methyltransferase [Streptosporangiaceae bacterium]|nr:SAM-dependent methyltransferase [Streptosporangiaceae bacterium]